MKQIKTVLNQENYVRMISLWVVLMLSLNMGCATMKKEYHPVRFGADNAGGYHLVRGMDCWKNEKFYQALDELGMDHFVLHLIPRQGENTGLYEGTARMILDIDAAMRAHGKTYAFNVENPNFSTRLELTPGENAFSQPDGTHRWDVPLEWLEPLVPPQQSAPAAFKGIVYDEIAHMQLSNNKYSNYPYDDFDQPFLVNTHGMELEEAFDRLVEKCRWIKQEHYEGKVEPMTEQVWPDLFHIFARAGWTIGPKLLKEHFTPLVLCVALGAAIQYEDQAHFQVSPDLWRVEKQPGHSVEALRSSLLMGYWLGAETIYIENLDFKGTGQKHPDAEGEGMLLRWKDTENYELTPYGKVAKEFGREYVPSHPRPFSWRDYQPRVAIVRLPDGGWGQWTGTEQYNEPPSRNRLLGNREHPIDEPAREWLKAWEILTHGVVNQGSITMGNPFVYPDYHALGFFVPLDSVAVFDHLVEGPVLDSVECFIVCGHALSGNTFQEIRRRVEQGATCVIARRLYEKYAEGPLPGQWQVVDSFDDPVVAETLKPYLGQRDVARYRFEDHVVEFHKTVIPDRVEVKVVEK
jgi:hypothetical protein